VAYIDHAPLTISILIIEEYIPTRKRTTQSLLTSLNAQKVGGTTNATRI